MTRDAREVYYDSLVRELNSERAATLGRAGAKLEAALAECAQLRAEALAIADPAHRAEAETRHRAAYVRYIKVRDEFCLYREALGLLDHRRVDEIYRPPAPL